jgi:hypothetical protein
MTAQSRLNGLEAAMNSVKRRLDWYTQFAPDHPYKDKFSREYEVAKLAYEQAMRELKNLESAYAKELAPFENEAKSLNDRFNAAEAQIRQSTEEIAHLPLLDRNGEVSQRAAVRWLILKEERQLKQYDHDKLLNLVIDRIEAEPQRFPKWLQYMVIHFSGMRYQSAHGSWADARDLLESLMIEDVKNKNRSSAKADLDRDFYTGETVNLESILREQVLLTLPLKPLCAETCKGLCPGCGTDLNQETCQCPAEESTSPLAILKKIKL